MSELDRNVEIDGCRMLSSVMEVKEYQKQRTGLCGGGGRFMSPLVVSANHVGRDRLINEARFR